jgi:hypothetical protein
MAEQLLEKPFGASIKSRTSGNSSLSYKGSGIWGRGSSLLVSPLPAGDLLRIKESFRILCKILRRHPVSHCIEGKQPFPTPATCFWDSIPEDSCAFYVPWAEEFIVFRFQGLLVVMEKG